MSPFLIDTHAHLNFNAYQNDRSDVISRALDKHIWMINVGSQYNTSKTAIEIAAKYNKGIYAAIGLHPIHLFETEVEEEETKFHARAEKFDPVKYQALINSSNKIVAIGEIGLDYFHKPTNDPRLTTNNSFKKIQKQELVKQLQFANKNKLPVILHCRGSAENPLDAYHDLLNIIKSQVASCKLQITGAIHCFSATADIAQKFIDFGFYIGFTGIITFGKNADPIREVVKNIPLEKILVETDCPYLSPEPHRGKRNEPSYVEFVASQVTDTKKINFEKVKTITTNNAMKLFNIK